MQNVFVEYFANVMNLYEDKFRFYQLHAVLRPQCLQHGINLGPKSAGREFIFFEMWYVPKQN